MSKAKDRVLKLIKDGEYWAAKKVSEIIDIKPKVASMILLRLTKEGVLERRRLGTSSFEYRIVGQEISRVRLFDMYLKGAK